MKIRAIAALLFILISVSAFGEGRIKITGYVRDADGNPLELVNVRVKNTLIGSMTNEKDAQGQYLPEEQRMTKFGKLLRSSSLDELPELWCIFTGKMSFVGPRPLPTYYGPYFLPEERKRHTVRGGLIPPDSLSGKTYTTYEEQFAYECYYAEHLSFLLDIKVIYTTFRILWGRVTTGYGAQMDRPHLNVYRKDMDKKE